MSDKDPRDERRNPGENPSINRRDILLSGTAALASIASGGATAQAQQAQPAPAPSPASGQKPNILMIMGDDIGWFNPSIYHRGIMGYRTPNIDRIGKEGALFTDWYGEQSCTAGRAAFITGQSPIRTGLTKVGLPGADIGLQPQDPTVAELLKPLGYVTRPVRQEPSRRQGRVPADQPRLRRVLRQSLPPQCRGGAGEPRLSEESGVPQALRAARRDPLIRRRQDRGHRAAHQEAHGDRSTRSSSPRRSTSSTASTRPASRGSATSTPRACTSTRI